MKNIYYCSNAHTEIFKNNTRSSFNSYIDIHHLSYLHEDDIEAAIKSITYDGKTCVTIKKNYTKPYIMIRHKIKSSTYDSLSNFYEQREKKIYTTPDLSKPTDYVIFGNGNSYNEIYQVDHKHNFCNIQILTPKYVMHNIYLHETVIFSENELIQYINSVLKNVSRSSTRTTKILKDILQKGDDGALYLNRVEYDIDFESELANILNLDYAYLKAFSGRSLRGVFSWLRPKRKIIQPTFPDKELDIIFDYKQYLKYYKVKRSMKTKQKLNMNLFEVESLYGIKSNISEKLTVRNAGYDDIISVFVGNKTNDVFHIDFKNPTFFPTRKELLSRATFQIIDIDSNSVPNFDVGAPTYIQVVVRKKKNMEKKFNVFLDSSCEISKAVYPENNATNFTIDLPERLSFRRDWQVTLKSLFIADSIHNVPEGFLFYYQGRIEDDGGFRVLHKLDLKIKEGNYPSINNILNDLSEQMLKAELPIKIELHEGKVKISCPTFIQSETVISILMSADLAAILGFVKPSERFDGFNIYEYDYKIAPFEPDLFAIYPKNLIIGCNVVDNTIFGGEHVKLLRMVTNTQHSSNKILSFEFLHDEYVDLIVREFKSIKIAIMDATGNFVKTDSFTPTRLQLTFCTV